MRGWPMMRVSWSRRDLWVYIYFLSAIRDANVLCEPSEETARASRAFTVIFTTIHWSINFRVIFFVLLYFSRLCARAHIMLNQHSSTKNNNNNNRQVKRVIRFQMRGDGMRDLPRVTRDGLHCAHAEHACVCIRTPYVTERVNSRGAHTHTHTCTYPDLCPFRICARAAIKRRSSARTAAYIIYNIRGRARDQMTRVKYLAFFFSGASPHLYIIPVYARCTCVARDR